MSTDKLFHTETELIAGLRDENTRSLAFSVLLDKYQERLYWHLRKMLNDHADADDALQNTFMKAWQNIESFRGDSKLFTWLYRVASNEGLAILQRRKKKGMLSIHSEEEEEGPVMQIAGSVETKGADYIERKLEEALDTLPEKQRLVFQLKYFEEMKYEEMSEVLETSVGALKASYHHAVKKIQNFIGDI
ncbi:MAG: sigma-70 family RNA polymerase sigma factor [Bacteroidetes bacterium]|nr:MAG: sigma-70 family RNA polymerase sigma factor [Bacteroidota bacterium]